MQKIYRAPVTISVTAPSYLNIMAFAAALEKDSRMCQVESISITKQDGIKATFTVGYFYTLDNEGDQLIYPFNKGNP